MKVKRQKHARKVLAFFHNNFLVHPPYNVLLDGTFCKAALSCQVNIQEQMPKYLQAEANLYTTPCVLAECESFGTLLYGPLKILQQYTIYHCGHSETLGAANCLYRLVKHNKTGKKKFLMATNDENLREQVRKLGSVPVMFMAFKSINLEDPSDEAQFLAAETVQKKIEPSSYSQEILLQLKKKAFGKAARKTFRKKRCLKGPNPLSCKRKKQRIVPNVKEIGLKKKGRKKRKVDNCKMKKIIEDTCSESQMIKTNVHDM